MATSQVERKYRVRPSAKEPWTVEWLEHHVRAGHVLYDVGANVGVFSLIGALQCGATVVAFEPGFANYARLCENIHLNGCGTQIIALPFLLADHAGLRMFEYRSISPGQSRHVMHDQVAGCTVRPGHYAQPTAALTLDEAVSLLGLPVPHHIKLDVDGAEAAVLDGALATLRGPQLQSVMVEADETTGERVTARLADAGLRPLARHIRADKPRAPWYGLFIRDHVNS